MVPRIPVWAGAVALWVLGGCPVALDDRCRELADVVRAQVLRLARGCATESDCGPFAGTCGTPEAVHVSADTREVSRTIERYQELCGCSGSTGSTGSTGPVSCMEGRCQVRGVPPAKPAVCEDLRLAMQRDVDRQNRCRIDDDCSSFNILACPPICGRPTARGADPGPAASLLTEYNQIPGCRDCEPRCAPAGRTRCLGGLCAAAGEVQGDCVTLAGRIEALLGERACERYADCAWVSFFDTAFAGRCGAAVARGAGAALAPIAEAWRDRCCAGCPRTCVAASVDGARCERGRCIAAPECPRRFADAPRGWTLTWRTRRPSGGDEILLIRNDGVAALSPPAVQTLLDGAVVARLAGLADAAGILCLDSSFHRSGDTTLEITATVPDVGLVELRWADGDPRPAGLAELQAELDSIAGRLRGGS